MSEHTKAIEFAKELDLADPLNSYRDRFHIPKDSSGNELIYFCGNSLGLQPKTTKSYIDQELHDWANLGVEGHFEATNPWMPYHEYLTEAMAKIVGAKKNEVVVMNTLTTNLHLMMVSFYRPTPTRYKILIEGDAFPSDDYAVSSQLINNNIDPNEGLIKWTAREGEDLPRLEDLEAILKDQGHEIALIMIGAVNYYTGQFFNLKKITELGHQFGCKVGFDCAHGAGNVPLDLHDSGADFAVWCSYKYLNSGPGSLAGCFVHERHANDKTLKRFAGWWGHNKNTRFNMRHGFDPIPGAEGWQLSNPPILSMAAIKASLDIFNEAGIHNITKKSKKLSGYLQSLITNMHNDRISIITPKDEIRRGCQVSIKVSKADKSLHDKLTEAGVITDWREPDVIRAAPVALYNTFEEVFEMVERLKFVLN
ncbi:kynureninase [Spongiivirga citrea]|uniref:Kynureninase n=1 Tax=Spongiivirga citrea TaxID=1481457 RepID=A0A6M0CJV0_9FLAO|nr:kynureninase [Spongiivirga citrea]NER16244.1 kynureninase [Spongiivirga citrea]